MVTDCGWERCVVAEGFGCLRYSCDGIHWSGCVHGKPIWSTGVVLKGSVKIWKRVVKLSGLWILACECAAFRGSGCEMEIVRP